MLKCSMHKLRTFRLSHPSKVTIAAMLKAHADDLQHMDPEEHDALAARARGQKIGWPKHARVDGLPLGRTIEEVDHELQR